MNSLLFWNYYFMEEGEERDDKLYSIYKDLLFSNIYAGIFIGLALYGILYYFKLPIHQAYYIVLAIVILLQAIFEIQTCYEAFKRVEGIESLRKELKEGLSLVKDVSVLLVGGAYYDLKDGIIDILEEYFNDNIQQEDYQKYQQKSEYEQVNYDTTNNDIKRVMSKYNLSDNSTSQEIKKTFRSLAKKYHPDMPTGDTKKFMELKEDMEFIVSYLNNKEKSA